MSPNLYPVTPRPEDSFSSQELCNNAQGTDLDKEALERFKIRELCEGWPSYRDAADWPSYRSIFFPDAYITTTWHTGPLESFISASSAGFTAPSSSQFMYITHRANGAAVTTNKALTRAVCKLKTTISCRFTISGTEMDNEADCRFFFLLEKRGPRWGVCRFTALFDKDRLIRVNPERGVEVPEEEVRKFPVGYRYLAWAEEKIGLRVRLGMDAHGPERDVLGRVCRDWIEGGEVPLELV